LVLSGSALYGTALGGGSGGNGTVFALNTNGTGFTTLHAFSPISGGCPSCFNADGGGANSLVLSSNTLYGTAGNSGSSAYGTVFGVNIDGTGFTVLYSFGGSDGAGPSSLSLSDNTLYGVTGYGGNGFAGAVSGSGTIFSINTDGTGFTTLYSFSALGVNSLGGRTNSDGSLPRSLVMGGRVLYGPASYGGNAGSGDGSGTVFAINSDGTGFTVLHRFAAYNSQGKNADGAHPQAVVLSGGTLYGTANGGGVYGYGTIFSIVTNGTGFRLLHTFDGTNGAYPIRLVLAGNVLFVTGDGGNFSLNTDGTGFSNTGNYPSASGLVWSPGALFGTDRGGGYSGDVFALSLPFISPRLKISLAGANSVLTWPASPTIFTLESTTNVAPGPVWNLVSPAPVLVNGQNTVTNPISGPQQFYRLSQ